MRVTTNRVRDEFTRQAETFSASAAITDAALTQRFYRRPGRGGAWVGCSTLRLRPRHPQCCRSRKPRARWWRLDLTPQMLTTAAQRVAPRPALDNVTFREGTATELPFADAAFDAVVTRLSVHHFDRPGRAMSEIFRVLRPGGRFVLADVISSELPAEAELQNAIEILRDPSHVRMLPGSELAALVRGAGFAIRIARNMGQAARVRGVDGDRQRRLARPAAARGGRGRWPTPRVSAGMGLATTARRSGSSTAGI